MRLLKLFFILVSFKSQTIGQEYKNPYYYGFYYKPSTISRYNSNKTLFSLGNSFGYSYNNIKPNKIIGIDCSIEFLSQNINTSKVFNYYTKTYFSSKIHFSTLEFSLKASINVPLKKVRIYFNPGLCFGTFQFLKRKEFEFSHPESKESIESNWVTYGTSSDGLTLGAISDIGFNYQLNEKTRLFIDYDIVVKAEISTSSNFSYLSHGLRIGINFKSSETKKKIPYK